MKSFKYLILLILSSNLISAQNDCPDFSDKYIKIDAYTQCILTHRREYILELTSGNQSPLTMEDKKYIQHFDISPEWWIKANYTLIPKSETEEFVTSTGEKRAYKKYAELTFNIKDKEFKLYIYQSLRLLNNPIYKTYLFLPFTDLSNGDETYGGGRYIDLELKDLKDGYVNLDFNKAYNPYCAYSNGYSCPIPPKENHLRIAIDAGEKEFTKPIK